MRVVEATVNWHLVPLLYLIFYNWNDHSVPILSDSGILVGNLIDFFLP